jgi:hypothetical protein
LLASGLQKEEAVLELFKRQLKKFGNFKYVASARVRHRLINKSHFYLVYGTRHEKGLQKFREVEKKALHAEEHCRSEAREDDRLERTGQFLLLPASMTSAPPTLEELRAPEMKRARAWLLERMAEVPVISFESAVPMLQEPFSVTYSEVRTICEGLGKEGLVEFDGMKPGQRKPDKGVSMRRAA